MQEYQSRGVRAHVFIFPLPLQGPVNCMLKLAEILCLDDDNIKVTFLNTHYIHQRLNKHTDVATHFAKYPNFCFETVPDGLPEENPRTGSEIRNLLESMEASSVPILREMLTTGAYGPLSGTPVTCLIADGIFTFATDIAAEVGVPLFYFDTISPCGFWTYLCLPNLILAGELPFKDDNLDEIIRNAPGMEGIMRRRDLPSFCRSQDLNDPLLQAVLKEDKHIPLAQGLIFNTFQELEGPILSQILNICPNVYAVGPLHTHLRARLAAEAGQEAAAISSNSIWEEDKSCISWLNKQPSRSVIFVSIGSLAVMTKDQMHEIWHGLMNSGARFLWVRRPGSVIGLDSDSEELLIPPERGYVVSWAPQEEVLAHSSVGAFLTHSGWNSTLECIVSGKPMICWPYGVDQQVNSRYVGEVWKLGLDMKDTCDRVIVEKMVREVMELRKDEFLQRAEEMAKLAGSAIIRGGSSFADVDRLIHDIKMIKITPPKQS